jgi:hypothetical protein
LSNHRSDPWQDGNSVPTALPETTSTSTTAIKNYWRVASLNAASSDWFIHCGCTTHISRCRPIVIAGTKYLPNTNQEMGNNWVIMFPSGYWSIRLICQLQDGKTEIIILQEVVHFLPSCNLIPQSQMMDLNINVELVDHYNLIYYNYYANVNPRGTTDRWAIHSVWS